MSELKTWRSGRMVNGERRQLPTLVKLTRGHTFTTPCAADSRGSTGGGNGRSLRDDVRLWPTACASDGKWRDTPATARPRRAAGKQISLHAAVLLAEPVTAGPLNPYWVEWLMGYPQGWTAL